MQEMAAQIAVHSPALSEMAGHLFHGFVGLFQRSVTQQEARLRREREAHEATRVLLREANAETLHWRAQKDDIEKKLGAARRLLDALDSNVAQSGEVAQVHHATAAWERKGALALALCWRGERGQRRPGTYHRRWRRRGSCSIACTSWAWRAKSRRGGGGR